MTENDRGRKEGKETTMGHSRKEWREGGKKERMKGGGTNSEADIHRGEGWASVWCIKNREAGQCVESTKLHHHLHHPNHRHYRLYHHHHRHSVDSQRLHSIHSRTKEFLQPFPFASVRYLSVPRCHTKSQIASFHLASCPPHSSLLSPFLPSLPLSLPSSCPPPPARLSVAGVVRLSLQR